MMRGDFKIVLASASPRRAELIKQIGFNPIIKPVGIDESAHNNEAAEDYCLRMAAEKLTAAADVIKTDSPILTADTIVVIDGEILGKPKDETDALLTLNKLSGRTHQVYSAVSVQFEGAKASLLSRNQVSMVDIDEKSILSYVASGEPMDKAGAYGIQGYAAMWIEHIEGSYSSIMGLPLFETAALFRALNIPMPLNCSAGFK